jgi:pyruvate,water dikinase
VLIPLTEATTAAGAKAATLGKLLRAGFPVPPGFVLTETGDGQAEALGDRLAALNDQLAALGGGPVAVRSSATGEDSSETSAAGQHDSFLGVQGVAAVLAKVEATQASLWSPRATAYREARPGSQAAEPRMAVIVQRHVDAEVAGVLFTPGSPTGDTVIEASWGLGEQIVQGLVTPDRYTVGRTITHHLGDKRSRVDRAGTGTITTALPAEDHHRACLSDAQLQELHHLGQQVAELLGSPQDIEFAVENGRIWLLQSRPITASLPTSSDPTPTPDPTERLVASGLRDETPPVLHGTPGTAGNAFEFPDDASPVLHGTPGSAGLASGPARIVRSPEDFHRVRAGDVLVCRFTDPAWTPLFGVVAAVVTEVGGQLSHAAIVAREHRIPAVLGVAVATNTLADGEPITVNGTAGTVAPTHAVLDD